MASSSHSTADSAERYTGYSCGGVWGRKAHWSGFNIAAMVLGFVFFWPIGLFVLFWIMQGRNAQELPPAIREKWLQLKGSWSSEHHAADNVVFSEYQQTQYDRIHEIKAEIRSRARRFHEYRASVRRGADQEEFNRFMADTPAQID